MAKINQLHVSADAQIRSANVKLPMGHISVIFRYDVCRQSVSIVNSLGAYIPQIIPSTQFRDVAVGNCSKCQAVVNYLGEVTGDYTVSQLSILKQKSKREPKRSMS